MSKPATGLRVNPSATWNRRVAVLGFGLLVILPVSFTALAYLVPKAPSQSQRASSRAGWYLNSGQWHADVRTLVAAFEFVIDLAPDAPAGTNSPNEQLAVTSRPAGPNSRAVTHVQVGSQHLPNS